VFCQPTKYPQQLRLVNSDTMDSNRGFVFQKVTVDMHTNSVLLCAPTADYVSAPPKYKRNEHRRVIVCIDCRDVEPRSILPMIFSFIVHYRTVLCTVHATSFVEGLWFILEKATFRLHGIWIYCKLDGATKRVRSFSRKVLPEFLKMKIDLWANGPIHCALHPPLQVHFMQYAAVLYKVPAL
jgi:hypothetical protein